ncbi:hypothetical protein L249_2171 [Ophiocordyceps polyrhachis-furcata BCC 54312]|uniref:Heterokaryon incompatibility domain-containing protein n=1 Tax=Ophiocordyceps polyrhachis-furcata BCC 54312 TaxID=1330021 RepID=A0A367LPE2_9HYPO|nr:hypothetical protein L249_2171 [Ophiocordyceps polyrhachis-furcata BCC 54312]
MPESPQPKRRSFAGRLIGSFRQARREVAASADSPQRRDSPASAGQSPLLHIRQWLEACNADHGSHCLSGAADAWRPRRLVDVVERRLACPTPGERWEYAALSYVAGVRSLRAPRLLASSVEAFQLALPDAALPATFGDAIWLTRKLGLRYLWIDRLCIVDDDADDVADHALHMASVFASAHVVIIAAHGDADTGLLALDPRRGKPSDRDHDDLVRASRWNTRCWTLQERIYARRAVYLFEDSISWECHCEVWQGSQAPRGKRPACVDGVSSAPLCWAHAPWPDMDEFARIAADYSARSLTLVDDTIRALLGVTHVLSRAFSGGFVYGMPLMFMDAALLWRPQAMIRRRALSRPPYVPSWAWMGWWFDGIPVDLSLWRASTDYVEETRAAKRGRGPERFRATHSFRLKSTVTWHLTDRMQTVPVASTGLRYRELRSRRSSGASLPPGWSRTGSHFRHDSDSHTVFRYPVPVEDPAREKGDGGDNGGGPPLPGPLLSFRTTSAMFEVDYAISMVLRDKANPPMAVGNIWSRSNRWIGELRSHDGWLGVQTSNYDGAERLEFIAVSSATERRGSHVFGADRFEENMDADEAVDIVNVLWIERIADVAYRRGIGHIVQQAWEAEAVAVDVLLG